MLYEHYTVHNLCVPFSHTACCMNTILYTISVSHSLTLHGHCIQSLCPILSHCMLYEHYTVHNLCVPFSHTLPAVWTLYCTQSLCPILSHSACCMDTILYTISVSHSLTLCQLYGHYTVYNLCVPFSHTLPAVCTLYSLSVPFSLIQPAVWTLHTISHTLPAVWTLHHLRYPTFSVKIHPAPCLHTHCKLPCHTKISQFGVTFVVEEDVASLDVSVDLPSRVEVLQTLKCVVQDCGNLSLH